MFTVEHFFMLLFLVRILDFLGVVGGVVTILGGSIYLPPFAYFYWLLSSDLSQNSLQAGPIGGCKQISDPWHIADGWKTLQATVCSIFSQNPNLVLGNCF